MDADRATLFVLDPRSGELVSRAAHLPELPEIRLQKGHTEGLEPNVTDKLIQLATSAKGGKIRNGAWTPPPQPAAPAPFGAPAPAAPATPRN